MYILASKTDRAPQDLQTPFTVHNQKSTIKPCQQPRLTSKRKFIETSACETQDVKPTETIYNLVCDVIYTYTNHTMTATLSFLSALMPFIFSMKLYEMYRSVSVSPVTSFHNTTATN